MKPLKGVPDPTPRAGQSYQDRISSYQRRHEFCGNKAFHLPTEELISLLCKFQPLISVGCGLGFTEAHAQKAGCDIIPVDLYPDPAENVYTEDTAEPFTEIIRMDAQEAVLKWQDRNVFMAWPPYESPMAADVARAMAPGKALIYIGESHRGCTADSDFFSLLESSFKEIPTEADVLRWERLYDSVCVYTKTRK